MNVNHELAHTYIAALSCTKEGRELVEALESVRYYHFEGKIAELGHGSVFVTAIDAYDGEEKGTILLPGNEDRLSYQSADWMDNTIKGALFWEDSYSYPVVIPYALGEWAAECILTRSGYDLIPVRDTKPALYRVDVMPGMYVHMPKDLKLPGLTYDKYVIRKLEQDNYRRNTYNYHCNCVDSHCLEGFSCNAPVLYGATAGSINHAIKVSNELDARYDIVDILTGKHYRFKVMAEAWRAACQLMSNYVSWEYFDTCSLYQCAKHIILGDFTPMDI